MFTSTAITNSDIDRNRMKTVEKLENQDHSEDETGGIHSLWESVDETYLKPLLGGFPNMSSASSDCATVKETTRPKAHFKNPTMSMRDHQSLSKKAANTRNYSMRDI